MFITVQPHEAQNYQGLIHQFYCLRKRTFHDQLGWDVPVDGDIERDEYDDLDATYLFFRSADGLRLYAGVRLMRTTGPTLLNDVFGATHGHSAALKSDGVWEVTRMCVDAGLLAIDHPEIPASRAINLLLVALCESGLALGIRTYASNFELPVKRVYERAGLAPCVVGSADGYGKRPVYCATFDIDRALLRRMRTAVGIDMPVWRANPTFATQAPALPDLAA